MDITDTPNDYTAYQGEVDTTWLRQRIDHAMDNVSDLVIPARQAAELCQAMEERDVLRDMADSYRETLALIAEVTGMPKEPHQGFQHRLVDHARTTAEHAVRLNAKLRDINDSLCGHGFEVANHHLNGELEWLDNWFEENDWEPEDVALDIPIVICPTCCYVQAAGTEQCRECKAPVPGTNGEVRHNARARAAALQWVLEKDVSHQNMPFMIDRLTAIADGKRQPCPCIGMMCRGCPDCQGIAGPEQ
ncbi:hypothetical protein ACT3R7_11830 [Halomonas sp. AOP43-A1-21]